MTIIDRKKNIFKLAQGEYVAVEHLESIFKRSSLVSQIWVYGNSFKNSLVAVVVLNSDANAGNEKAVLDDLNRVGKESGLKGYEMLKAIKISKEAFSVENDLVTPTLKLKRPQLLEFFKKDISQLYEKLGEGPLKADK